jgi:hypothetical protein
MKAFVVLIALFSIAYVTANSADFMNDPSTIQIFQAMDAIKADLASMKSAGNIDDRKLIASLKSAVALMNANVDKAPPALQSMLKGIIADIQTKIQNMDRTGKFDESALDCTM